MAVSPGMRGLLSPARKAILGATVVGVASSLLTAVVVMLIGRAFSVGAGPTLFGWAVALLALRAGSVALGPVFRADTYARVRAEGQALVYRHVLDVGPAVNDVRRSGELVSLAIDAVGRVAALAATFLPLALRGILVPVAVAGLAMTVDPLTGLVMLLTLPLVLGALRGLEKNFRTAGEQLRRSQDRLAAEFLDAIRSLETLVLYGAAERRAGQLARHAEQVRADTMAVLKVAQRGLIGVDFVYSLVSVVGIGVLVAWRISAGAVDAAGAVTLVLLSVVSISALVDVVSFFYVGGLGLAAFRRIRELFDVPSVAEPEGGGEDDFSGAPAGGEVVVEHLTFRYGASGRPALDGLSLTVPAGTSVALVGRSGAGKSTLASLLLGLRRPESGRVMIDGVDIARVDREWLAGRVAYVGQDTHLFSLSVADNLRVADPRVSRRQMEEVCRRARILDWIESLPAGFDTVLGESGSDLSGGEAQRLGIARAFLADTPVLVLDEATSGLDLETEALVHDALEDLMIGRTTIAIAHRITTARRCDLVAQIEDGVVVAVGPPEEMDEGFFARMRRSGT
jgi:ATP-binding cassette, subfamily C, bacterial CydD